MMTQDVFLEKLDWHVRIYYAADTFDTLDIIDSLVNIGCNGDNLKRAKKILWESRENTGLTYTCLDDHESVIVIIKSSSAAQYYNSFCHEQLHVMQHISQALDIDPYSEEICYIHGELAQRMFRYARNLLCDCCQKKAKKVYQSLA